MRRPSRAGGKPRTATYKVVVGYFDGYMGSGEMGFAGHNALARAKLYTLRSRIPQWVFLGLAALLGLVLASTALRWLHAHPPAELPSLGEIAINGSVLTFAVAVTAAAAVLSSLAPMVGVWRIDVPISATASRAPLIRSPS